jgi:hypothetical protein
VKQQKQNTMKTSKKSELKEKGYSYTTSTEERKAKLNKSINNRMSKRFEKSTSEDRFFLTTIFL